MGERRAVGRTWLVEHAARAELMARAACRARILGGARSSRPELPAGMELVAPMEHGARGPVDVLLLACVATAAAARHLRRRMLLSKGR